ncbi:MAG: hypothetical protein AAB927_02255 [Patescibacteria group bacterium]
MSAQIDFKTRQATAWIIGVIALGLIGWDIYAAFFTRGDGDTISEVVLGMAKTRPVVPFLIGVVCGHCFWSQVEGSK